MTAAALRRFSFERVDDLSLGVDRVAAIALLREDGAALMQLRDDKPGLNHANMWVMPGGHCDTGEAVEDAARREFLEETGYVLHELDWLVQFRDQPTDLPPYTVSVFRATYDGRQPLRCGEGQALEFLPREEADRYAIPRFLVDVWDLALAGARTAGTGSDG